MGLFRADPDANLLPCDGEAYYHGSIFGDDECGRIVRGLMETIPWAHDETVMFGKRIVTKRKVAWRAILPSSRARS